MKSKIKARFQAFKALRVYPDWGSLAINAAIGSLLMVSLGAIVDGRPDLALIPGSLFVGFAMARGA
jgi:hypothetical protein